MSNATIIKPLGNGKPQSTGAAKVTPLNPMGPTIDEFVKAGYDPRNYPPQNFAPKSTKEEIETVTAQWLKDNPERAAQLPEPPPAAPAPAPSALDKALERTEEAATSSSTPATDALMNAYRKLPNIGPGSVPAGGKIPSRLWPSELTGRGPYHGKTIPFSDLTVSSIVSTSAEPIVTDTELGRLRDLQAKYDSLIEEMRKWALTGVSAHLLKLRDDMDKETEAGNASSMLPTRESVHNSFVQKNQSLVRALIKLTHDPEGIAQTCYGILVRFEGVVEQFLREREAADRNESETWGLPSYFPSIHWRAGAAILLAYEARARLPIPELFASPKALLAGVVSI